MFSVLKQEPIVEICPRLPLKCSQERVPSTPHQHTGASALTGLSWQIGLGPALVTAEGFGRLFLRLGEVLPDDLSGLRGDPVGEVDGKLHDEVTAL